jgi:predicted nucleotidyltransferase
MKTEQLVYHEQIMRKVAGFGNGAHVFAPKEWMNEQVLVIRLEKKSIKEQILESLYNYLDKVVAVFIYGSYARDEASENSDIDILVIAKEKFKIEKRENFEFIVLSEDRLESAIKSNPILMHSIFKEGKAIINEDYIKKYQNIKLKKSDFLSFIASTKESIVSSENLLELDKETGKTASNGLIYSLMLRLRGTFIMKCLLNDQDFSNKGFEKWMRKHIADYSEVYEVYQAVRDDKKLIKDKISLDGGIALMNLLKSEMNEPLKKVPKIMK